MDRWLIYVAFVFGYAMISVLIGVSGARARSAINAEEYFLAGRGIGTVVAFLTMAATALSSYALLGIPSYFYTHGIGTLIIVPVSLTVPLVFWCFAFRLHRLGRAYHYITLSDFLADRFYSRTVRLMAATILALITIPYISIHIMGFGYVLQGLTEGRFPYTWGASLLGAMMVVYIFAGGYRGVAWTDVFQGVLMLLAVLLGAGYLVGTLYGGLGPMFVALHQAQPEILRPPGPHKLWTQAEWLSWLAFVMGFAVQPQMTSKFFSVRDEHVLRVSLVGFPVYALVIYTAAMVLGFVGVMKIPGLSPKEADQVTMLLTGQYLPILIGGLMAAGIIAASMSTASGQFIALSSIITCDFFGGLRDARLAEQRLVRLGKWLVLALFFVGFGIGLLRVDTLVNLVVQTVFPFGAQVFVPMLIGLYWRRATREGAIAGMLVGTVTALLMMIGRWAPLGLHCTVWASLANLLVLVIVSRLTPPPPDEVIERIFIRNPTSLKQS